MDPHSSNKLFATKYCFLILVDDTSFFFFISLFLFFLLLFYVIINFYKNHFIIIIFFFMTIFFIFLCSGMFLEFPECSGMFQNVPCSGFYRRPEQPWSSLRKHPFLLARRRWGRFARNVPSDEERGETDVFAG